MMFCTSSGMNAADDLDDGAESGLAADEPATSGEPVEISCHRRCLVLYLSREKLYLYGTFGARPRTGKANRS